MKKIFLLLSLLMLTSCGTSTQETGSGVVQTGSVPYVGDTFTGVIRKESITNSRVEHQIGGVDDTNLEEVDVDITNTNF